MSKPARQGTLAASQCRDARFLKFPAHGCAYHSVVSDVEDRLAATFALDYFAAGKRGFWTELIKHFLPASLLAGL
jgi:hypothetical protein